jgi:thymidylate synthase
MNNNIDKKYTDLLQDILDNGVEKKDRTLTGTISVFGRQIRHKMSEGFPLLTTKKMAWKTMVTELLWFLRGDTNIKYLVDNDCHIWDGDAYKNFEKRYYKEIFNYETGSHNRLMSLDEFILNIKTDDEFAKKWGQLGPIYGKQWRNWEGYPEKWKTQDRYGNWMWQTTESGNTRHIDQIANSINLLKTDPDSRRNRVNAWNVGELDQMVLPPCHTDFQFYTREMSVQERQKYDNHFDSLIGEYPDHHITLDKRGVPRRAISLMWNQRSCDFFLGIPFNIASYGLLLEIIAKVVNMVPDELIGNLGDVHLYSNHIEQAKEQIGRELTHIERVEKLFETNKDAKSLLSQEEPEVISSLLLDELKVPKRTREPYPLPTLKHMKTDEFFKVLSEDLSMIGHLDNTDFQLENYQSHPTIKAPLSN